MFALIECMQAYFTLLYFFNPFISIHVSVVDRLFEIFEYTKIARIYSLYLFIGTSVSTAFLLFISSDDLPQKESEANGSKSVFGMSFKACESIIYWLSFFSSVPSIVALLVDFIQIINFPYISEPSYSQVIIGGQYAIMFVYQYLRYISLMFPNLSEVKKRTVFLEILQIILSFAFLFNPYRETNRTIFEYFYYTTHVQFFVILIHFFSLFFNTIVYYRLKYPILFFVFDDPKSYHLYGRVKKPIFEGPDYSPYYDADEDSRDDSTSNEEEESESESSGESESETGEESEEGLSEEKESEEKSEEESSEESDCESEEDPVFILKEPVYEVIDGTAESSTKNEIFYPPNHWIKRRRTKNQK
uniref:Transmembrane protein n=1 Tax=Caenorhabditis tropicalis TaxID=1561998 RepID=A0A1I7TCD9_9PELO